MSDGIRTTNLPLDSQPAEFLGHVLVGGVSSIRRFPRASVLGVYDALIGGAGAAVTFTTKAQADTQLAYAANIMAWVVADPDPTLNGVYQKQGSSGSGSWLRVADLPYEVIAITVTGGTANAIQGAAYPQAPTTPQNKLFLLTPSLANTAATFLQVPGIAGGAPVAIKNAFGSTLAANSLLPGSQALMAWLGGRYQLLISASVDASSILSDAVAARDSAAASATSAASYAALFGNAVRAPGAVQGRLTLTSNTAVMTASVAGATRLYYTPAVGNQITLYDGTSTATRAFAQMSCLTTDVTKNPSAIGASKVNDWFVWDDSGTLRLVHGLDWTDDTTRSAGNDPVMVNGVLLNGSPITNGPAAQRGTYVGTTKSNASGTLDFIFGFAAPGGGASLLNVWNAYNQTLFTTTVTDNSTWSYNGAARAVNGSSTNRISFVTGMAVQGFSASYQIYIRSPAAVNAYCYQGIGFDTTTAMTNFGLWVVPTANQHSMIVAPTGDFAPVVGAHFLSANESTGGGSWDMFGTPNASTGGQNMVLSAQLWA